MLIIVFTTAKIRNQSKCSWTDEWKKKMEYYLAFKKQILSFATTWMNLENLMLSDISQAQKDKNTTCCDPIYMWNLKEFIE